MAHVNRPVQERILSAADRLFYGRGIRAVGVDAIAGEAGVSKRTLYSYYRTKDDLVAAYLTARFRQIPPSDAPAREQILGYFERMERLMSAGGFRGCPYVNAVTEIGDRKHAATAIAIRFKEERLEWYRALLERMGARDAQRGCRAARCSGRAQGVRCAAVRAVAAILTLTLAACASASRAPSGASE